MTHSSPASGEGRQRTEEPGIPYSYSEDESVVTMSRMDCSIWTITTMLQVLLCRFAAGHNSSGPDNVTVVIKDGQATVFWDPPKWALTPAHYQVELKRYGASNWTTVPGCDWTRLTHCDVTDAIINPIHPYFVRVRLVSENTTSEWKKMRRRFCLGESELLSPVFVLLANSSSVRVRLRIKPIMMKIFPSGLLYKIYLKEPGQKNQTSSINLLVQSEDEFEKEAVFGFLQSGGEYCVSGTVEAMARNAISNISAERCILLPRPEWYGILVIALVTLSILAVLSPLVILLQCMVKPPKKLPITLRSSLSSWRPLSVTETPVESVTDKGWLMMSQRAEGRSTGKEEKSTMTAEEKDVEERRDSTDSGVSMGQRDGGRGRGEDGWQQEDSGWGSLSSSSRGGFEEPPLLDGRTNGYDGTQKEDSGVGLRNQPCRDRGVGSEDCEVMMAVVVVGDGYRNQAPSFVDILDSKGKGEETGTPSGQDSNLSANEEYRPSQYPTSSISQLPNNSLIKDFGLQAAGSQGQEGTPFLLHPSNTCSTETAGLIFAPQLPLLKGGLECYMKAHSLSLQDVELTYG